MIECTNNRIWYKRRRGNNRRIINIIVFILISVLFLGYIFYIIPKNIFNYTTEKIYSYCADSVNSAISISLVDKINYSDLIYIEKDNQGNVSLMSTNSQKVNEISVSVVKNSKKLLEEKLSSGVEVPLLAFTGINLISGFGKTIKFKNLSVSSVVCNFISKFESVGINQTLHSIYININLKVNISCLLNNEIKETNSKILISETIIVGKVPSSYLNGKLFN